MRLIFDNKEFIPSNAAPLEVMTKEQYKILTEEEKTGRFFLVESRTAPQPLQYIEEVYSEEETRIGTWFDGKPLYRKTYICNQNVSSGSEFKLPVGFNIDSLVYINGYVKYANAVSIMYQPLVNKFNGVGLSPNKENIVISNGNTLLCMIYFIVIEYTKTTD